LNIFSGTFITEFGAGKEICHELLASDDNVDRAVDALVLLMAWYCFDGYLLNIENPIEVNLERKY
jgi:mannosyl-glycoprotein endo-beta-N-acetylglucosaminidase